MNNNKNKNLNNNKKMLNFTYVLYLCFLGIFFMLKTD